MEISEDLQALGLTVGRIVEVAEHVGARAPSYLLTIDLGPRGRFKCSILRGGYEPSDLESTQVVCAPRGDEVLLLAAHSHAGGLVLVRPDRDVEIGTLVG